MHLKSLIILAAFSINQLPAQELSEADREIVLKQLTKIQAQAQSNIDAKFSAAASAYRSAASSNTSAMKFYLQCIEKVRFKDKGKKYVEFREWKRKEEEKLKDQAFSAALRQQLYWLLLTLEAASEEPNTAKIAVKAEQQLQALIKKGSSLKDYRNVLQENVTGTVFAHAYEINKVTVEDFPTAPLQVGAIYENLLLPPLRTPARLSDLRTKWTQRIKDEGELIQNWQKEKKDKKRVSAMKSRKPAYQEWIENKLPEFRWNLEVDVFKAGGERIAATNMLQHLRKHINHQSSMAWLEQLNELLVPTTIAVEEGKETETKEPAKPRYGPVNQ